MYRVLLKIDKVSLKIKETVQLHIIIRKEHKYFTHCKNETLKDGSAKLTNSSEFLIDARSPKFEIEIYLLSGDTKKKGGVVLLNLKNYNMNTSHRIVQPIKKTPLTHSSISIDFVYMQSEYSLETQSLISLQKLEEMLHKQHLKQITDEHEKLLYHNSRLSEQISKLKEKNTDLSKQANRLQKNMCVKQESYSIQLKKMEKEKEKSMENLQQEKQKVAKMVGLINDSGDNSLLIEMEKVMNNSTEFLTNNC